MLIKESLKLPPQPPIVAVGVNYSNYHSNKLSLILGSLMKLPNLINSLL